MDIQKLLSERNVSLQVSPADLTNFGKQLIEDTMQRMAEASKVASDERISAAEAAERLGVSLNTLWRWERQKYLIPTQIGRRVYYRAGDIEALAGNRRGA